MNRSPRRFVAALMLPCPLVFLATAQPAAAGTSTVRHWVDNDGLAGPVSCDQTAPARQKIQKAIDDSDTNDKVLVCPGTYVENLVVGTVCSPSDIPNDGLGSGGQVAMATSLAHGLHRSA